MHKQSIHTAMARPCWTEIKITPTNAHNNTTKSNLSTFQIAYAAGISMRPTTAVTMIAPSTTFGVYWNKGIRKRRVTITVTDITMLDAAVFAPALWFTADLEKAPVQFKVVLEIPILMLYLSFVKQALGNLGVRLKEVTVNLL